MIKYLKDEKLNDIITDNITLVDFYADWCGPCKMMSPIIDKIAEENIPNVKVGKLNGSPCKLKCIILSKGREIN